MRTKILLIFLIISLCCTFYILFFPKIYSKLEDNEIINRSEKFNIVDYSKPHLMKKKNYSSIKYFYDGSDYYLSFDFIRFKRFNTKFLKDSNADTWGMSKVFQVDLINKSRINQLVREGEWNTAILVKGANDHVGGIHGDEVTQRSYFLLDGIEREVGFEFNGPFNELEYIQESNIFFENSPKILAKRTQKIKFDGKKIYSSQIVKFQESARLERAWITMLPISRTYKTRQITEFFEYKTLKKDVSDNKFEKQFYPLKENETIKIYGEKSKFGADIKFSKIEGVPNPSVFVSNAHRYNKIYISAFSKFNEDYITHPNETWEIDAIYSFEMGAIK